MKKEEEKVIMLMMMITLLSWWRWSRLVNPSPSLCIPLLFKAAFCSFLCPFCCFVSVQHKRCCCRAVCLSLPFILSLSCLIPCHPVTSLSCLFSCHHQQKEYNNLLRDSSWSILFPFLYCIIVEFFYCVSESWANRGRNDDREEGSWQRRGHQVTQGASLLSEKEERVWERKGRRHKKEKWNHKNNVIA